MGTNGLGRGFAAPSAGAPLGVRTEEHGAVHPAALGMQLPLPQFLGAPRESLGVRHRYPHHDRRRAMAHPSRLLAHSCCPQIGVPEPRVLCHGFMMFDQHDLH